MDASRVGTHSVHRAGWHLNPFLTARVAFHGPSLWILHGRLSPDQVSHQRSDHLVSRAAAYQVPFPTQRARATVNWIVSLRGVPLWWGHSPDSVRFRACTGSFHTYNWSALDEKGSAGLHPNVVALNSRL